jgi:hypothetical protein
LSSIFFPGHSDPAQAVALLHLRCERPRRCATDERDELAPFHCAVPPELGPKDSTALLHCGIQFGLCRLSVIRVASARLQRSWHVRYASDTDRNLREERRQTQKVAIELSAYPEQRTIEA